MGPELAHAVPRLSIGRLNTSTGLELPEAQAAWPVIFLSNIMKGIHNCGILAFGEEILGSLAQTDYGNS